MVTGLASSEQFAPQTAKQLEIGFSFLASEPQVIHLSRQFASQTAKQLENGFSFLASARKITHFQVASDITPISHNGNILKVCMIV